MRVYTGFEHKTTEELIALADENCSPLARELSYRLAAAVDALTSGMDAAIPAARDQDAQLRGVV